MASRHAAQEDAPKRVDANADTAAPADETEALADKLHNSMSMDEGMGAVSGTGVDAGSEISGIDKSSSNAEAARPRTPSDGSLPSFEEEPEVKEDPDGWVDISTPNTSTIQKKASYYGASPAQSPDTNQPAKKMRSESPERPQTVDINMENPNQLSPAESLQVIKEEGLEKGLDKLGNSQQIV